MNAQVQIRGDSGAILGGTIVTLYAVRPGCLSPINGRIVILITGKGSIRTAEAFVPDLNMTIPLTLPESVLGTVVGGHITSVTFECDPLLRLHHDGPTRG